MRCFCESFFSVYSSISACCCLLFCLYVWLFICVSTKYDGNERATVSHCDLCSVVKTKDIPGFFLILIVHSSYKRWSSGFQAYRLNIYTIWLHALSALTISLTLSYSWCKSIALIFTFALLSCSSENHNKNCIEYSWKFIFTGWMILDNLQLLISQNDLLVNW